MPTSLVIVESPAKARTIAGYLDAAAGGDTEFRVEASVGHIRDLPGSKAEVPEEYRESHGAYAGVDPRNHFDVVYVVHEDKKKVVRELKQALRDADELILATDEDREGEAISWHVREVLAPGVPVRRMVFHEITPQAIREALASPRELDMKLVEAQEGRRVLDRLVGWDTSPALWQTFGKQQAPSAGRVQSVAVRLVVERERERMAFRSGSWHDLEGTFDADETRFPASLVELDGRRLADGKDFDAATGHVIEGRDVVLLDGDRAAALAGRLSTADFRVRSVEANPFTERPKPPFTTSTLQQEAGRKLRFGSAKTMAVAQRLYERGYITYMRTDSTALSDQAVDAARNAIRREYGEEYLPDEPRRYRGKVKNAQEAHEAIRPAGEEIRRPDQVAGDLDADERRLYELVWIRTVACQMVDARGVRNTLRLGATSSTGEDVVFRASGKTYRFLGFRRAYVEDVDEGDEAEREARLPDVAEDDAVTVVDLEPVGHETKPPARYTEASLVKELEARGIGRPSTYAAVIQTIQHRGYAWRKGSALVPSWTAFGVVQLLEQHFAHLVDYGFTAEMEEALDVVARGEGEAEKWLHSFYYGNGQVGLRELASAERIQAIDKRAVSAVPIGTSDDGTPVIVRVGRFGPYAQLGEDGATASLPTDVAPDELTVDDALELIRRQAEGPKPLGEDPETGLPVYVLTGRFGPYVQLGEQEEGSKEKPKRASLFATMTPERIDLDEALALLSLPRVVGTDDEGVEITAQNGRYGPYLKRGSDTRSLETEEQIFSITRDGALALLAQPKRRGRQKPPLAELGESPDTGKPIVVKDGRYGPYVTDGETNASIPRGRTPEEVTTEEALALLRERAAKGPAKKKKPAKKKAAKKKAPAKKKSAKKSAPKQRSPAKRKSPAKRSSG